MITGRCPRCHGTMTAQYDNGWEEECLQCGYIRNASTPKTNNLNHRQYDVGLPYTSSPASCTCVAYNVIPYFARQNSLARELHGRI
jgi:Zn ribbon nucleic-acid-binding protein